MTNTAANITTPAQALAAVRQAQAILAAVAESPALSCAPTNDPRVVEWTEDQGAAFALLVDDITDTITDLEA